MGPNPTRVRKTLAFLLRHRPDIGRLEADAGGWYDLDRVAQAVSRLVRARVSPVDVADLALEDVRGGYEVEGPRIRVRPPEGGERKPVRPPDILYLPATRTLLEASRSLKEIVRSDGRPLHLHNREHRAWSAAHRRARGEPRVLYVDASRAARAGVVFRRIGGGLFTAERLPVRFVLNLRPGFALQASAGGFLVRRGPAGQEQVALVRVRRQSGVTWEVAKGKMEPGESPADTAKREIREEMGIDVPLEVVADLGISHYGFTTPAGEPRLKVLHLFILQAPDDVGDFQPSAREGIEEVAFFSPEEAVRVVTHGSLREPVRRLQRWMEARRPERGAEE